MRAEECSRAQSEMRPSLEWLIDPVAEAVFFAEYWEKRALLVKRGQPDYFGSLLTLGELDRTLTTRGLSYPQITLKNADREISADDYTLDGETLDVAKVYQLFAEGSTITLAYLDTLHPPLTSLCRALESQFSFPCQVNAYLTPPGAKGARHHYDTHDVFVLQMLNSKRWTTYGTPVELPLREQDFDSSVHERGDPTLEFKLEAGEVAYIPRGLVHDARSGDELSLHLTVGVLSYTWIDLIQELAAGASLNDPAFRKSLPPGFAREGFDRASAREACRGLLHQLWAKSSVDASLDHFADRLISACPPLLQGQMAQMAALDRLTLASLVGARAGAMLRVRSEGEATSVDCYGRRITFPSYAEEAVRFALNHTEFAVRELPGNLDEAGKLTLVRRLIREGLVAARSG